MDSNKNIARTAGLFYLIVVITGIFNLLYVPSKLIVWNDAAITFNNIVSNETLFRLGIVAGIICYIAFLFLPLVLYKLLSPVNKTVAISMVALAVVSVPISLINLNNKMAVLTFIGKFNYLNAFQLSELNTQVMLSLEYYNNGIEILTILWGLWLLPFGYLVFKSGFLPKVLGIFLMIGCFGYLINFVGGFLFSGYADLGVASFISIPGSIGEIGICLWLLILGAKEKSVSKT
jgi:Domain of unknown function (DUF4386)